MLFRSDRSSKIKINKETQALNDTIDQIDLIDIYRTFHPKTTEYTFFSGLSGPKDTIKLLEENTGRSLFDINHSNILLDPPPREMEIKTNKWDIMKL